MTRRQARPRRPAKDSSEGHVEGADALSEVGRCNLNPLTWRQKWQLRMAIWRVLYAQREAWRTGRGTYTFTFELTRPLGMDEAGGFGFRWDPEPEDFSETTALFTPRIEKAGLELVSLKMGMKRVQAGGGGNYATLIAELSIQ